MKSVKKILMSIMVVALAACMALSMFACNKEVAKTAQAAFAEANTAWTDATGEKSAVDDIALKVSIPVLSYIVDITAKAQITRTYNAKDLKSISGKISDIKISGIGSLLTNSLVSGNLPAEAKALIDGLLDDKGNIVISGTIAEGTITVTSDKKYNMTGTVYLTRVIKNDDTIKDITGTFSDITVAQVQSVLDTFGVDIDFDMISLYDFTKGTVSSSDSNANLKVNYNPKDALSGLLNQVFGLADKFLAIDTTDLENDAFFGKIKSLFEPFKSDEETETVRYAEDGVTLLPSRTAEEVEADFDATMVSVVTNAKQYIEQFAGKTGTGATKALLEKLISLGGSVDANIVMNGNKFKTISGQQIATLTVTYADADSVIDIIKGIPNLTIDNTIITAVTGLLWPIKSGTRQDFVITATADFTTTLTY